MDIKDLSYFIDFYSKLIGRIFCLFLNLLKKISKYLHLIIETVLRGMIYMLNI